MRLGFTEKQVFIGLEGQKHAYLRTDEIDKKLH